MIPMRELPAPRQPAHPKPPKGFRRIFANPEFTLHLWYDRPAGSITEFHIFSGALRTARISWTRRTGLRTGRATERGHWGADGGVTLPLSFDRNAFQRAMAGTDRDVRDFVLGKLSSAKAGSGLPLGGIRTHL